MVQLISRGRLASLLLAAVFLLASSFLFGGQHSDVARAQGSGNDYFLKIDGIEGESADETHRGEIEIHSYSWGKDQPGLERSGSTGSRGGGAGKVSLQDIHFTKFVDKASPKLMIATSSGKHFSEAVLTVRKAGDNPVEYHKITMQDVLITSYQTSGSGGDAPIDNVSLNFTKIEFEYSPQNPDGSLGETVRGAWDFKLNKEF